MCKRYSNENILFCFHRLMPASIALMSPLVLKHLRCDVLIQGTITFECFVNTFAPNPLFVRL